MDEKRLQRLIERAFETEDGRRRLADSMLTPLRARRDYTGVARRVLNVDPLPVPCSVCGMPPDVGAAAGCHVCVVHEVLDA